MKPHLLVISIALAAMTPEGQAFDRYQPVGNMPYTGVGADAFHPIKAADRVVLPGLRPPSAELLQRTLRQRYRRSLGNSSEAISRKAVPKILSDGPSFARARGIYAEFWYVNRNSHVGLVGMRNATQHDAYSRPLARRAPIGYQIKVLSGGPANYAHAMLADHRSPHFVIPDDHVQGVRDHWQRVGDAHAAAGRIAEAQAAYRQRGRVCPLGTTLGGLDTEMRDGGRYLLREQTSRYVSYGAVLAMSIGPALVDLIADGHLSKEGYHHLTRGLALSGTAAGTNHLLGKFRGGALRGTLRGNVITGTAFVLVDTAFAVQNYGGSKAFSRPEFYEGLGGSIGGVTLSLAVGIPVGTSVTALAIETGLFAPIIGGAAGLLSGTAAAIVGQIGGTSAARFVLGITSSEMLLLHDLEPVHEAKAAIETQIALLQSVDSLP